MCFFLAMPTAMIASGLFNKFHWWWVYLFIAAPVGGFAYTYHWLKQFKCPRCNQPYFPQSGPLPNMGTAVPLRKKCQGCGLPAAVKPSP